MLEVIMARTNFQYEKRQRELEKKRKADEKAKRKLEAKLHKPAGEEGAAEMQAEAEPVEQGERDPA
jgi:hypothetical protein